MASSSIGALLVGVGGLPAHANCGAFSFNGVSNSGVSNSGAITCIDVQNSTISGNVANTDTGVIAANGPSAPSRTGITINNSTVTGAVVNSGVIGAGATGILIGPNAAVVGGVSNSGTISAIAQEGIHVFDVSSFSGGIGNSGTISASAGGFDGIAVGVFGFVSTFAGGISNGGTISAPDVGIQVFNVANFAGNIINSRTISADHTGIWIHSGVSTFIGNISNSGTISALSHTGIHVDDVTNFAGGISNSGTISAGGPAVVVSNVAIFGSSSVGGISNSGAISAGGSGINVYNVATFMGGIANSIGISAGSRGIGLSTIAVFGNSSAGGGLANSGTISAGATGINIYNVQTFMGGIANQGTISAGATGIWIGSVATFSGNVSNSGAITGSTGIIVGSGVTFAPGRAIVNTGTITGTGGTAIDDSAATAAVTIDQNAGLISGAIKFSLNADVLNVAGGAIAGDIVGQGTSGTINFNLGSGAFSYAYDFTGISQVNINSGTVALDGIDSAATTAINNTGILTGTGTLNSAVSVQNGGTFAPGTPGVPGTSMTIGGTLTFQMNAAYVVYLNPSTTSLANVTGTAALGGAVNANFAPGSYSNKSYDILHSSGLNGTTFDALVTTGLPQGFDASLSYTSTDVLLTLAAVLGNSTPLNTNQQNVAHALNDYFNSGGTLPPGFASLFNLSGANLANALTALDGENATGAEHSAFQLMNEFLDLMLDPYADGRSGGGASGPLGFAPDQADSLPPDIALAYAGVLKAPPKPTFEQRWTAWGSGFGGSATTNGDAVVGSNNVTTSTYGYAAGMDYHYSPDTVMGFALAGGGTGWNLAQGLGTGRSMAFMAGGYGITHFGPAYVAGSLAFANNWFTTNRTALADQLSANFQGQSYAARLESGYRFVVPVSRNAIGITPYAAIQAQDFHTPAYSETDLTGDGFGLSYNAMNGTDTRSELGGRFDDLTVLNAMPVLLRARVAWAHDWVSNPALNAAFQTLPGSTFTVNGAPIPHNAALTSAGAELFFTPNWSLIAKFDGEFASGSQLYAGTGTLHYTW